ITSSVGVILIVIFFVTSSDSGSFVDVMVTSGGHPNPPKSYRAFWCITEGVVAATLLIAGGLTALRTASLTPALPMVIFLLAASYGLFRALRIDQASEGRPGKESLKE
ncbi:MAG: BCCT family transporter, partial [Balneolales bacterium]